MKRPGMRRWRLVVAVVVAVGATALLGGPVATWLQARARYAAPPGQSGDPDGAWSAVYLVAGARAQARRIAALEAWVAAGGTAPPILLIGHDPQKSFYSPAHGRHLTRTEWAIEKVAGSPVLGTVPREIVPGRFYGTDAEMQALGEYLATRHGIRQIALVTCRFHGRRVLRRFIAHAPHGVVADLVPGTPHRDDRLPWIVAGELLKLARDRAGLSRAPLLSRPGAGPNP